MVWFVDLVGEATDVNDLSEVVKIAGGHLLPSIVDGPDGRKCLSGPIFDNLADDWEVRRVSETALKMLNGLARLRHTNHRPVALGTAVSRVQEGRRDVSVFLTGVEARGRVGLAAATIYGNAGETVSADTARMQKALSNPSTREIIEALSGDVTYQRLRVAFEKLTLLIDGKRLNYQSIWKKGYAERAEVEDFKATIEDPRNSGLDSAHGVPQGKHKAANVSPEKGLALVRRLFNAYLDSLS